MAKEILEDFDGWQKALVETLMKATRAANAIPAADVPFYRAIDRDFKADMDEASSMTLSLCDILLQQASNSTAKVLSDPDDLIERFDIVSGVMDDVLEKVDYSLDEMASPGKKDVNSQSAPIFVTAKSDKLEYKLVHAQHLFRPQIRFPDPVDNSMKTPFIRKITEKPNAKVDLTYGLKKSDPLFQPHPYEYEINHLEYPAHMFEMRPEQLYHPFDTTSAIWVDTEEALKDMCTTLEMQREIAVDLEHHNYRSFQGFTCLMQISTRDQDFLVDTLELRGSLHLLNNAFTDPKIVKVFHGAESDIIWLQRDFGVYVVNMFDTYNATKLLEMGQHSLAFLLDTYASFHADKKYQLADWRIRPLPKEMSEYARADTHFLLYIYDKMRNALLEKSNPITHNLLHACLQRSAETSLKKHEKEVYDAKEGEGPNGWRNMYTKWNRSLDSQQFAVFKALHAWRDHLAREEDDSLRYVLPNHMLFTMSEKMPIESAGVLGCCNPIPPPIKMHASDLAMLIASVKASASTADGIVRKVEIKEPVHVRFDPATGLQPTNEKKMDGSKALGTPTSATSTSSTSAAKSNVTATATSNLSSHKPSESMVWPRPIPEGLIATRSSLFGDDFCPKPCGTEESRERVAVTNRMIAQNPNWPCPIATPVFKEINSIIVVPKRNAPLPVEIAKRAGSPMEADKTHVAKKSRTDVLVIGSMSKQRSRAVDEDRAELKEQAEVLMISSDSEDDKNENIPTKKAKNKKKKHTTLADSTTSSSASSATSALPESFQPFDYSTVHSIVDETVTNASSKGKGKKKIVAVDASEPPKPFDPYAKLQEDKGFKKKDASFSSKPKSGSRSYSFKR
ncbi:exosome nuclease subunit [Podila humilis]|nr:exosome nuclease subunit [Podila humilis]